ncbi:MAG: double zinc ribbon domain-containing protein [Gemmatimonadota bacterium]
MAARAELARRVERWLLPAECMSCLAPATGSDDGLICAVCIMRWRPVPEPRCGTCGEPLSFGAACRLCAAWPAGFGPVRSAVQFDERTRGLVHRFKYAGWWRLADVFAGRMASLLTDVGDGDLVPVPLARRRLRRRGYNQAERLAAAIARQTGLPLRPERLHRDRETPTQTRLTPEARLANLAGAFTASSSIRPAWLVDDVFTTGATLTSAAQALLDAGAPQVGAVTFARAEPPLAEAARRLGPFTLPIRDEELE